MDSDDDLAMCSVKDCGLTAMYSKVTPDGGKLFYCDIHADGIDGRTPLRPDNAPVASPRP